MPENELNIILGGLGFVGFNLVTEMVKLKSNIVLIDDMSNAVRKDLIADLLNNNLVNFINSDINNLSESDTQKIIDTSRKFKSINFWHLAANSDIRSSINNPYLDLEKTLKTSISAISLCKQLGEVKFIFSSSSAVYGSHENKLLSEDECELIPTSNYGITKLASELFLRNSVGFEIDKLIIFRFPNVLGTPSTHGVIHDWIFQASKNKLINVLGDGSQRKQYLNVRTLISCMTALYKKINSDIEILNIGPNDDGVSVKELMNIFLNFWPNQLEVSYEQKNTGWRGDINRYRLDVSKISKMGITPELKSLTEVEKSIFEMVRFSKS